MSVPSDRALVAALADAQRLGFLGARPIPEVIAHARGFVHALEVDPSVRSVLDLGSGGGVPGLVIANDRPDLTVTLLDRRSKRTDFLRRVVGRLGWDDRVKVVAADAANVIDQFDAVVARGFGPPQDTLRAATRLAHEGGVIVISEPPDDDRWDDDLLDHLRLARATSSAGSRSPLEGRVAVFLRR